MTSFQTLLCKIPKNIDTKQVFVEIKFVSEFLNQYKKYLNYAYEFINVIEKSYRSSATSLESMSEKCSVISNDLPESNIFTSFVNSHKKRSKDLLDRANLLSQLQKQQFKVLIDNFDSKRKSFENKLSNLKQLVQPCLNDIYKSLTGYDKYFTKLQQSVSSQPSPAVQQQFQKALTKLDEKLSRTQTNYNTFHKKFAEYCSERDIIFGEIDKLIADSSEELKNIIQKAASIDNGCIDPVDFNQPKIEVDISSCWKETKDETPKSNKFAVTLISNVLCGNTRLNVNDTFTVVEAKGDYWLIEDDNHNKYEVPSENLKVKPIKFI